uniref:Wall-associated receptor kinase galacturonan-binding domain-containing protein n=1 Tax=Hordeum vulgare subsp. vulgare TaxID=112509 RepID=A0A8I6YRM0_HORVV
MYPAQVERYLYENSCSLPTGQKLLLLVAATLLLHQSSASSGSISMARPGCPDKCGNTSIPFPFGIGKGCFQEPFNVTCNGTGAYLGSNGLRVLDIALTLGEVRVQNPHIATRCNFSNGSNSTSGFDVLTLDPFHTVSNTKNKLTSIGCGGLAMVVGQAKGKNQLEYLTADSCISSCMDVSSIGNGTECSGIRYGVIIAHK